MESNAYRPWSIEWFLTEADPDGDPVHFLEMIERAWEVWYFDNLRKEQEVANSCVRCGIESYITYMIETLTSVPLSTTEEIEAAIWLSEIYTTADMEAAWIEFERIGAYDPDGVLLSWYRGSLRVYQIRGNRL